MKKLIASSLIIMILTGFSFVASAQEEEMQAPVSTPKWLSEAGYWVIENNINTPKSNIIYFYDNDNNLVYKEKLDGVKIKVSRNKTLFRLKGILEQSVTAWQQKHILKENQMLVALALK